MERSIASGRTRFPDFTELETLRATYRVQRRALETAKSAATAHPDDQAVIRAIERAMETTERRAGYAKQGIAAMVRL